jgi:HPt (histidine-containing phosphotransfer) domain-containing protein
LSENEYYNRADALERLGGDEALFANVVNLFVSESAGYCRALEEAMAAADAEALRREAHTVKSMLATFSCETGRELALRLEVQAASGSLEGADRLTAEVAGAVRRLAEVLAKETA